MKNFGKRLLSLAMALFMVLSLVPFNGLAIFAAASETAVAKVGNTEYTTIDGAIADWTNNSTLTLLADVTLTDVIQLSSTEHHTLDLGTYTMTAASKKDAIQIVNNGRSSASYTLDIKADATNPGGITATGKTVVVTTGKSGVQDRPIIRFYNGIFNGSYVVKHSGSNGTNCPQFQFHGGVFNGTISTNRALNQFYGGTFNGSMFMSVDSSAYTLIAGGTFKNLSNSYGSALNSSKFTIGSAKGVYDKEVYIDDNGNYVIAAAEPAEGFEAAVAKTPGTNDYLKYSKVATEGVLKYTDAKLALQKNNTTSAKVTVYADELDMTGISYKGTIVAPEGKTVTVTNAPEGLKTEGNVIIVRPVAQIGDVTYNSLQAALDAAVAGTGNVTVEILQDVDLTNVDWNPVTVSGPGYPLVTVNGNNKTITGLNDMLFAATWAGKSGLIINDLTIKDSHIVNDKDDAKGNVGVGAFIGYPQASATITLNNCHLVDSTVEGGHWTGGLIGMAGGYNGNDGPVFMDLTITGCSVTGSTIAGKGSAGGVIGHGSCADWTKVVIKDTEVSGNTITSTGSSTNKAGSVMGTIGAAGKPVTVAGETKTGGAFVAATTSDNVVTSNGTTITTIYGRQGSANGMLTLTGGAYDAYPIEENVSYAAPADGYKIAENADGSYGLVEREYVAEINGTKYETLQAALDAAKTMTGDVVVEIYKKVTLNTSLSGSYDSITFVGKAVDAEIYLDVQGYITATGKKVAFEDLTLSKVQGGYMGNAGFMNVAFGIYDVSEVTYKGCTFANGAYASSGEVTYNDCTFKRSWEKYGLWAYGNVDVTVDGCTFADYRGIKMYAEGAAKTVDLTVKNTDFTALDNKPAIVLTYGQSVTLEDNTYSATGTFELDLGGAPDGTPVATDTKTIACVNDNGPCGVLVDGKIYTSVAQAATVATAGSTVILLHDSTETVELEEGVILDKNGYAANGITVKTPVVTVDGVGYADLSTALKAVQANSVVEILSDITIDTYWDARYTGGKITVPVTINGNGHTIKFTNTVYDAGNQMAAFRFEAAATVNDLTIDMSQAQSGWGTRLRAISAKADLTVDGCTFIGNGADNNTRAIIFGEGAGAAVGNVVVSVTDSTFIDWRQGVSDNENAQDVKSVTITGCTFTDAGVNVSAAETINFNDNTVTGRWVKLTCYTSENLTVNAQGNTLTADGTGSNVNFAKGATLNVQDEFLPDVAEVNGQGFASLDEAIAHANTITDGVANIKLLSDVEFGGAYIYTNVVLDLNGHVITATGSYIFGLNPGSLTVKDSSAEKTGKLDGTATVGNAFLVYGGALTIESGIIHAYNNVIFTYSNSSTITINGGELKSIIDSGNILYLCEPNTTTTINGGTFYGPFYRYAGTLLVNGGRFATDVSAYCAYGFTTKLVDGMYQIVEAEKTVFIGETGYITLEDALNAAKDNDIVEIRAAGSYVLKRGTPNEVGAYYLPKNLTIKGMVDGVVVTNSPAINATNVTIDNVDFISNDRSLVFHTYGDSVIKNCDLIAPNGTYYSTVNSGTLLVENCVFEGTATYGLMVGEGAGAVTVKDCTIQGWNSFGNTGLLTVEDSEFINGAYSVFLAYQDVKVTNTKFDTDYSIGGAEGIVAEFTDCSVGGNDTVDAMKAIIDPELIEVAEDVIINGKSLKASYVAELNGTMYETLQAAVDAATEGATVTLLADIELTEGVTVAADKQITLDLNGKTVSMETADDAKYYLIYNKGNLTITDSGENGKLSYHYTGTNSGDAYNTVESAPGSVLTAQDGTIENLSANCLIAYAIDGLTNGSAADVTVNIEGGKITSKKIAVRIFANSTTKTGTLNISGGEISGRVIIQNANANANKAVLNITGGTFNTNGYKTDVLYVGGSEGATTDITASVSGGTFNGEILSSIGKGFITGGTFNAPVAEEYCAEGYIPVDNGDGTYGVKVGKFVAQIGEKKYASLHEAMVACKAGETVLLIADVDLAGTEWEPVSFKGTFDGQNHTISNLTINKPGVSNTGFITSLNGTFKNVTFTNPTVTGGENTGVVAGRAGGSAALAENITVNGTIKVETTHSGYARAGVIVGGWAYGNYKNITVDGGDKAVSYIKHTGGGDGRYVGGIVGHADDVDSYVNCTVKNITIDGGWLCGAIAGPGPSDGLASGCVVENVNMNADYSGGMFGWYFGNGTIENSTIKDVAFTAGTTKNGAIGGYGANPSANVLNVTIENVTNQGKALLEHVAEINGTYYFTLAEALTAAQEGDTINVLAATIEEGTIKLPAEMKNITIKGVEGAVLKDMTIMAHDGNSIVYQGLTFDGITFENSRISITGWRAGEVNVEDLTVTNCTFKNLDDTSNSAPVHINMDADEAIENFTFTNNVIDGATGGQKSGVYAQTTGKTVFTGNTINNVSFRPYVIQITTDDGVADEFVVESNTFSGSAAGRAQGLGNNNAGTDNVQLIVTDNIFKGITDAQQICYWNFNEETTTADLSKNYYDIDILNNPQKMYYNGAAQNAEDLIEMGVFPYYADEAKTQLVEAPAIMVVYPVGNPVYPEGKVEYYQNMLDAVPYTTNCPRLEGAEIKLLTDIEAPGIRLMENDMVLDLNGHTYTITSGTGSQGTNTSGFQIRPEITTVATIKNGTIQVAEGAPVVWMFNNYATDFVVEDVTVDCANMAYSYGESCYVHVSRAGDNTQFTGNTAVINFNSATAGNAINVGGAMTIGENVQLPTGIELDPTATLTAAEGRTDVTTDEGYKVVYDQENKLYKVVPIVYVAEVNGTQYESLQAAIAAAGEGDTVTVLTDIEQAEKVEVAAGKTVTLDLNGKTLNGSILAPNADLTVQNGTIVNKDKGVSGIEINAGKLTLTDVNVDSARHALRIDGAVEATINGGTYRGAIGAGTGTYHAVNVSGAANVTIKAGTFVGPKGTSADSGSAVNVKAGASVTIEGGNFSGGKRNTLSASGTITVSGGIFDQAVAEELCAEGYICVDNGDGTYGVERGLRGSGTEADPYRIGSVDDLILFRDSVNAGETKYSAPGVYVALTADIDMAGINWVGIGSATAEHGFMGNFDGKSYKIKNLTITDPALDSDGYAYAGLFGVTEGVDENNQNFIKNLTIENVTISTTGHIVAAAIAYPYYTTVDNITVCGDINITGGNYTSGVLAYTRRCVNASNLTVSGNEGSAITGLQTVGGVISDIQMNGGLVADYSNFSVENVTITGIKSVGGISGIISNQTLNGATVKDVTLVCDDDRVGVVAGSLGAASTISNVTVANVTGATAIIGGDYDIGEAVEAKIGDTYYKTLADAIKAAKAGDIITLLVPYVVKAGETVNLDLKGATIVGTPSEAKAYAVITNYGNLTITDSVGGGAIVCDHQLAGSTGYAVNTIVNSGTLTIEGGIVENKSTASNQIGYAIDNNSTSYDAVVVIKGGEVKASGSNYYDAIRLFCNSLTNENAVTVEGGTVSSIWMQNPSDGATEKDTKEVKGSVSITGGTVNALYLEPSSAFEAEITDGYVGKVEYFTTSEGRDLVQFITGGTFGMDVTAYCACGYQAFANTDDSYTVRYNENIVAWNMQTGVQYETVQEALLKVTAGQTVQMIKNSEEPNAVLVVFNGVTLDLNGKTLTAYYAITTTTGSNIIDSTNGNGLLKVAKDNLVMVKNSQIMVWKAEDEGYRFATATFASAFMDHENYKSDGNANFAFYLKEKGLAMQELADGADDGDGLSMQVKITYTNTNGYKTTLYLNLSEEDAQKYAQADLVGNIFVKAIVNGVGNFTNVQFSALLRSGNVVIEGPVFDY